MAIGCTLSKVMSWLQGEACPVKHRLTFGTVDQLIKLLTSYLRPKLSMLNQQALHHFCTLLLRVHRHGRRGALPQHWPTLFSPGLPESST